MVRSIQGIRLAAACAIAGGLLAATAALGQGLPEVTIEQPRNGIDVATLGIPLTDIPLTVSYKSSAGVDKIEVLVNGAVQFVDRFATPEAEGRRSYLWDATAHGPGQHTISVIVFAGARSAGAQAVVQYGAVPSPSESQPKPTLAIVSPTPGAVVSGLVALRVEATNARPHWVQFFLDGRAVGHSLAEPYAISIDTSLYADGRHVVYAAMKTDRGTVTSETLHINFLNLEIPQPEGEGFADPVVEDPAVVGSGVGEEVQPVVEPVEPDTGPRLVMPSDPVEAILPPTDPINVGAEPAGEPELVVVEPPLPDLPEIGPIEVGPLVPETSPDEVGVPDLPPSLATPEEWQPLGAGEGLAGSAGPVAVAPVAPEVTEDPTTATDPSVRPLQMELAGPTVGAAATAEGDEAPPADPGIVTPPVPPAEAAGPTAPAGEARPVPPPLTPQLVEIDQPHTGLVTPLPPLTPLPSLTGPAEAALPVLPVTAPAGPVGSVDTAPPAAPVGVVLGPEAAADRPVAYELAGPTDVEVPVGLAGPAAGAPPTEATSEPAEPADLATAEPAAEPLPEGSATAPASAGSLATFSDDPVPVAGHDPLLAGPTGGPVPTATHQATGLVVSLNGTALEGVRPARVEEGAVYVALRDLVVALRGSVTWDAPAGRLTGRLGTASFALQEGAETATLRGTGVPLGSPPRVIDGALMVPLGFVTELLGLEAASDTDAGVLEFTSANE